MRAFERVLAFQGGNISVLNFFGIGWTTDWADFLLDAV